MCISQCSLVWVVAKLALLQLHHQGDLSDTAPARPPNAYRAGGRVSSPAVVSFRPAHPHAPKLPKSGPLCSQLRPRACFLSFTATACEGQGQLTSSHDPGISSHNSLRWQRVKAGRAFPTHLSHLMAEDWQGQLSWALSTRASPAYAARCRVHAP